jgi:hypothetical protein
MYIGYLKITTQKQPYNNPITTQKINKFFIN